MVSPVDVAALFTATTSAIDIAKGLKATLDKVGDVETKLQMAELISKLADAKLEAAAGATRIAELEQLVALNESMKYDGMLYWQIEGDDRDGPFCQRCFDDNGKAVRLQAGTNEYASPWNCTICETCYGEGKQSPHGGVIGSY